MNAVQDKREPNAMEDEHVVHMWQPFSFEVAPDYDYRRDGFLRRTLGFALRGAATVILSVVDRVFLGLKIEGWENLKGLGARGAVTVSNHVHMMDCSMIDQALWNRRMYYVTLESNFRIPLVRHLIRVFGGVPLSKKPRAMARMFEEMGKALKAGAFVQVYPEGVLHPYYQGLRPFKRGAFYLAVKNKVPVVPMVIAARKPRGLYRLYKRKPCLKLTILPPIYPKPFIGQKQAIDMLMEDCRAALDAQLNAHRAGEQDR